MSKKLGFDYRRFQALAKRIKPFFEKTTKLKGRQYPD